MAAKTGSVVATGLAVLTLIGTLLAGVPAFIQLTADRPSLYYSVATVPVLNLSSPDVDRVREALQESGIPDARTILRLMNKGTGAADLVVVRAAPPGVIRDLSIRPDSLSRPAWVRLPGNLDRFVGDSIARLEIRDFAAGTNVLEATLGFSAERPDTLRTEIDVVAEGREAELVPDVAEAESLTLWSALKWPVIILGVGVTLTVLAASLTVIRAKLRSAGVTLDSVELISQIARVTFMIR